MFTEGVATATEAAAQKMITDWNSCHVVHDGGVCGLVEGMVRPPLCLLQKAAFVWRRRGRSYGFLQPSLFLLQEKIHKLYERKLHGDFDTNSHIQKKKEFRNPRYAAEEPPPPQILPVCTQLTERRSEKCSGNRLSDGTAFQKGRRLQEELWSHGGL